jgi:hypothetical protein
MVSIVNEILSSPPPRRVAGRLGFLHTLERGPPPRRCSGLAEPPIRRRNWARETEILAK